MNDKLLKIVPPPLNDFEVNKSDVDRRVSQVARMMIATVAQDFQLEDLSSAVDLSPRHLERLFKRDMEMTPKHFLQSAKLNLACQLLRESKLTIPEIAERIGFQSQRHFLRIFKARHGLTPTQFRWRGGSVNC